MTCPRPSAKPVKPTRRPPVKQAPDDARGRTPTRGARDDAQAARSPKPASAARASGCRRGGGAGSGSTLDVARFLLSRLHPDDDRAHPPNWNQSQEASGHDHRQVHDSARRHAARTSSSSSRAATPIARPRRAARGRARRRSCRRCPARFPNPTLTVHLNFRVPTMTQMHRSPDALARSPSLPPRVAARAAAARSSRAAAAAAPQQPSEISDDDHRRRRRAAALRRARLHRAVARTPKPTAIAQDDRARCSGTT